MTARINPATGRPYGVSAKEWTVTLEGHVRRLSGCLLVIAGAQGVSEASLRNLAYEAAQGASVEAVARRLGVAMPVGGGVERSEGSGRVGCPQGGGNGMWGEVG